MLHCYTPEMGELEPVTITERKVKHLTIIETKLIEMKASIGHYGNYYVETTLELKGRGIKCISDHYINLKSERVNIFRYRLTDRAFEILKSKYDMKMECHLD